MIINNFRLLVFCGILILCQILVNNFTIFYVDLFAMVLVIMLIGGNYTWLKLIILSVLADLFGHWYLGSHLLAITLLSLASYRFTNFYKMCNWFQRSIVANLFFIFLNLIIYALEFIVHKTYTSFLSLALEVIVLMPLIQFILEKYINPSKADYIWYE